MAGRVQIGVRVRSELLQATRAAEVIGALTELESVLSGRRIDRHPAHRVGHDLSVVARRSVVVMFVRMMALGHDAFLAFSTRHVGAFGP